MAEDNKYEKFVDEAEKQLKRLEREEKRIAAEKAKYEKANRDRRKKQYLEFNKQLKEVKAEQDKINTALKLEKTERKEIDKYNRNLSKLSSAVRKELEIKVGQSSLFESISQDIVKAKAEEAVLEGEAQSKAARRETIMSSIVGDLETQAKLVEKTLGADEERDQFDQRRREIKSMSKDLTAEEVERLNDAVNLSEQLYNKNKRINAIQEQGKDFFNSMPESIKNAVSFGQGLISTLKTAGMRAASFLILTTLLTSAVSLFTSLDSAADKFNDETKLAISQMGEMQKQAAGIVSEFKEIGLSAEDFYNTQKELLDVFNDTFRASDSVAKSLAVVTKNFGATEKSAAKTLQVFENIAGVNTETAANLQLQTLALARQAGVAPAAVIDDIANSSETIYGAFQGSVDELVSSAITARRLGTEISKIVDSTSKLLDFESSITKELNAATFVGGQFNLQQARALRAANKIGESQEEILRQIQRSGDFRNKDLFTQNALAEAAEMTVEEIIQQLNNQEKLNSLGEDQRELAKQAIKDGLDITNISEAELEKQVDIFKVQKEQQGTIENIKNSFSSIGTSLGSYILPVVQKLGEVFAFIASSTAGLVGFVGTLGGLYAYIYRTKLKTYAITKLQAYQEARAAGKSVIGAIASIFGGQGKLPIVGAVIAATMVGALFAALSKASTFAGDVNSPARGKTIVSTKEGGLFELSQNDDFVAAPGASRALQNLNQGVPNVAQTVTNLQSSDGTDKLIRTIERLEKAYMKGVNLNLDGRNVTSRLSNVVDSSTRNNFNLA